MNAYMLKVFQFALIRLIRGKTAPASSFRLSCIWCLSWLKNPCLSVSIRG